MRDPIPLETVSLTEVPALDAAAEPASHAVSVYGADHPASSTASPQALAANGVNVVGLSTRVVGETTATLYVMLLEVALPPELDEAGLEELLAGVAEEQGVDVSVRPADGDVL